ncbi:MAG TPA: NAD(P)-dependent alcohol dehydrogenase [Acidimicrobiia bacterium]|nr:NAD(P)-dependent alcohol dehydrogenase [Acidimicrobiia bacterium]
MKAIVRTRYGSPDVLKLEEVAKPVPGESQILIRVHAASINASDLEGLGGKPLYARIDGPIRPRTKVLGSDVAGTVEAVGSAVEAFGPGDEVFGDILYHGAGAFAEYVCVSDSAPLVVKPANLTFEQAATLPQAAVIALQGIADRVQGGSRVLVNGGGGGAGTFAIQMAKAAEAEVTAVDNEWKQEHMRAQGADRVIDYRAEDYTQDEDRYDHILDLACHRSIFAIRRALAPNGRYAVVGGSVAGLLQAAVLGPLLGRKRRFGVLIVKPNKADLARAAALVATGGLRPIIDRAYPLEDVAQALRYVGEGRAQGKVIISVHSTAA